MLILKQIPKEPKNPCEGCVDINDEWRACKWNYCAMWENKQTYQITMQEHQRWSENLEPIGTIPY